MPIWIVVIFTVVILQRLAELWIAKKNERYLKSKGAIEFGSEHYKWFIIVHFAFFITLIFEMTLIGHIAPTINPFLLILFIMTQIIRVWCLTSLGVYWNTKIIILPNRSLVKTGPYKYVNHPNYIIVGIELCTIPLLFGAYVTALIFPLIHILLLTVRIPLENKALHAVSSQRNICKQGRLYMKKR